MYRMSDDQVSGGGVHGPSWLEMMASRIVCPETFQGWIYYCDEHDTHGNADSKHEAQHMASAHTAYFLEHDEGQADPCEVFIFARTYETRRHQLDSPPGVVSSAGRSEMLTRSRSQHTSCTTSLSCFS